MDERSAKFFGDYPNAKTKELRDEIRERVDEYKSRVSTLDKGSEQIIERIRELSYQPSGDIDYEIPDEYDIVFD